MSETNDEAISIKISALRFLSSLDLTFFVILGLDPRISALEILEFPKKYPAPQPADVKQKTQIKQENSKF